MEKRGARVKHLPFSKAVCPLSLILSKKEELLVILVNSQDAN